MSSERTIQQADEDNTTQDSVLSVPALQDATLGLQEPADLSAMRRKINLNSRPSTTKLILLQTKSTSELMNNAWRRRQPVYTETSGLLDFKDKYSADITDRRSASKPHWIPITTGSQSPP